MPLHYAIGLLLLFYFLLVIEFFLPSGGLLGAAAVAALIAAVVVAFSHSVSAGIAISLFALATTPLVLWGVIKTWPHTPIGRRMLNRRPGDTNNTPHQRTTADGTPIEQLVGHRGVAKTDLLPGGLVAIDSQKMDAVSTGMPIDAGTDVIVIKTDAGKIHVRAASPEELGDDRSGTQSPPSLESFDFD